MAGQRKRYPKEFKAEAVRLVEDCGLSHAQVARDLGVHRSLISAWVKLAREQATSPVSSDELEELKRLRRENAILRKEREILKKAAAFFAKESL